MLRLPVALLLLFLGCTPQPTGPRVNPLVNPVIPRAERGDRGWDYERRMEADLDGNGVAERIVLLAEVTMRAGQPVWDDSPAWQVYIEDATGERTYVFSRMIQLGKLEMRISRGAPPSLLLIEDAPYLFSAYEIRYHGPQDFETVEIVRRELNPAAAAER